MTTGGSVTPIRDNVTHCRNVAKIGLLRLNEESYSLPLSALAIRLLGRECAPSGPGGKGDSTVRVSLKSEAPQRTY